MKAEATGDLSFPHPWTAEILTTRPLILPPRHYVYPRDAEEVERGALEVLVSPRLKGTGFSPYISPRQEGQVSAPEGTASQPAPQPFLATCALGFRDAAVPTGIWSCPNPNELCAVSGGYAYIIDSTAPVRFTMIAYRPVLEVRAVVNAGLLLFVGHHGLMAWGADGLAWQSEKLSDEGLTIGSIDGSVLRGMGWTMLADKDTPFAIDLRTGLRAPVV